MDEIARLMEQANEPRDRAFLLIMLKIADKLGDLDSAFVEHRKEFAENRDTTTSRHDLFNIKFDAHVREEQSLINRGLGAWMVLSALLVFVLGVGGWYIAHHILDVNAVQQGSIDLNGNRLTALETMMRQLVEQHAAESKK